MTHGPIRRGRRSFRPLLSEASARAVGHTQPLLQHRAPSAGAGSVLGGFASHDSAEMCPALLPSSAFQRFGVFRDSRLFRKLSWFAQVGSGNRRKRQKMAIFPVTIFRGRALAVTQHRQQDTHGPSTSRLKQNAETRDLGLKARVDGLKTHGVVDAGCNPNRRGMVSDFSTETQRGISIVFHVF